MSEHTFPNDRLLELLADRAVDSLDAADQTELDAMLAAQPGADDGSMEEAAVALLLGSLGEIEEMPGELRGRVLGSIAPEAKAAPAPELRLTDAPVPVVKSGRGVLAWTGWLTAAACLIVAVSVAFNRSVPTPPAPTPELTVAEAREQFLESTPDVAEAAWGDWDSPEIAGVQGKVEWSESSQKGYMTFSGLAVNNPTAEQYQLWIIDERGMGQRVSGAIFDCDTQTGQCVVEIDPGIEVHNAAAFAVTIEQPGGTWVSDMSRRVVIAALNS